MNPFYRSAEGERRCSAFYDQILATWPVAPTSRWISTRHGATHVLEVGPLEGPPLVLLHGSASNALAWGGDVATWCKEFRTFAVDLPGEAGRSEPVRPSWDGEEFVAWLDDLLDGLGLAKASFVGLSLGGWVGLRFALSRPHRVQALVLLAPSGVAPARKGGLPRIILLSLLGDWGRRRLGDLLWGGKMPEPASGYMGLIGAHFRPRMGTPPLFSQSDLARLTLPLLLLVGAADVLVDSRATHARLSHLLPGADLRLLEGQAHAIHGQTGEILDFLQAHRNR